MTERSGNGRRHAMLDKYECLKALAARRQDEIIVPTMGVAMPYARLSDTPLDCASADSAMGHAADFAFGLAWARPERRVITLNGDGGMLMCLGTLVTVAQRPLDNYALVIVDNGSYEVTGNQPVPGAGVVDFAAMAKGAGWKNVAVVNEPEEFDSHLDWLFGEPGPLLAVWKVKPADEPPPMNMRLTLRERVERLMEALDVGG